MPTHTEQQYFPYSTRQLYDLVADVTSYPEFLPWCKAARILEHHENENYFIAELVIAYKALSERYTSKVMLTAPDANTDEGEIHVELIKGPFEYLSNHWRFSPNDTEGCIVDFHLDFKFSNGLLNSLISTFFMRATEKMVSAFQHRATMLYG